MKISSPDFSAQAFRRLSPWVRMAYAARCARRVQPLFEAWPGATPEKREAVERAISLVERAAEQGNASTGGIALRLAAGRAANVVAEEIEAMTRRQGTSRGAYAAIWAARTAACAAIGAPNPDATADAAFRAEASAGEYGAALREAMERDFQRLLASEGLRAAQSPSPGALKALFGPLWPEGEPPEMFQAVERVAASMPSD
jgi:hypothetical protein